MTWKFISGERGLKMNPETINELLVTALPLATAGTAYVLTMAGIYLTNRYRNNKLVQTLVLLDQVVIDVVKELNQTVVAELKKARADGKLTPDEAVQIKNKAIDLILAHIGVNLIKQLQRHFGPIVMFLGTKIEAAIYDCKKPAKTIEPRKPVSLVAIGQK
jgi:hypothetical protein